MTALPLVGMSKIDVRQLLWLVKPYELIIGKLYGCENDDILHRCALPHEIDDILQQCHYGLAGGHLGPKAMKRKVQLVGLWWPTLNKDTIDYARMCDVCKQLVKPKKADQMELHLVLVEDPFEKWGLDYVRPIKPVARRTQARYIVVITDYFTTWVEA